MTGEKTLAPAQRIDFGETLAPPTGYRLEAALGTTFSLDIATALTVPVAMALRGVVERDELMENPLAALAAMQRLQDRVRIFVEAGNIHPPAGKRNSLISLLEGLVVEVAPPKGATFHPKLWLLRFAPEAGGAMRQRLVMMSRNLTRDRSWDVALRLEGEETEREQAGNQPLTDLIDWVPGRKPRPVQELRNRLSFVKWQAVPGFRTPVFHAHFPRSPHVWRPGKGQMAVISPFCDDAALDMLGRERICALVSCDDWLARLNDAPKCSMTLMDHAVPEQEPTAHQERAGLHAKIFIAEHAGETTITLGSGNATSAGLAVSGMRNIEVFATLRGKTATVGGIGLDTEGLLGHDGLRPLLANWTPRSLSEEEVAEARFDDAVRQARHSIFAAKPRLIFARVADQWSAALQMECPVIPGISRIHARLATQHNSTDIAGAGPWILGVVGLLNVTRFIQIDLTGDSEKTASFVTQAEAQGLPEDEPRLRALMAEIIKTPEQMLSFVHAMLEVRPDLMGLMRTGNRSGKKRGQSQRAAPPVLETLLKVLLSDDGSARMAELDKLLRLIPTDTQTAAGFRELWSTFIAANGKRR